MGQNSVTTRFHSLLQRELEAIEAGVGIIRAKDTVELRDNVERLVVYLAQLGSVIEQPNATIIRIMLSMVRQNSGCPEHVRQEALEMMGPPLTSEVDRIVSKATNNQIRYIEKEALMPQPDAASAPSAPESDDDVLEWLKD